MRLILLLLFISAVSAFLPTSRSVFEMGCAALRSSGFVDISSPQLYDPKQRDATYTTNVAQYLCDLHDAKASFDFCGGMMFQLVLSDKLREHLDNISSLNNNEDKDKDKQPVIAAASKMRMHALEGYDQCSIADNAQIFHGREVRKVVDATGGMGFVLHLSLANNDDPEGWTSEEIEGYNGWKHDVGRVWRTGDMLEREGFTRFREKFGPQAFALHHRFYLHYDSAGRMWLSAEDGCEGTPKRAQDGLGGILGKAFGLGS